MELRYILTEREYKDLKNKQQEPNMFLEKELAEAKAELHRLREYKLLYDSQTESLKIKPKPTELTNEEIYQEYKSRRVDGIKKIKACQIVGELIGKSSSTIRRIIDKQEK